MSHERDLTIDYEALTDSLRSQLAEAQRLKRAAIHGMGEMEHSANTYFYDLRVAKQELAEAEERRAETVAMVAELRERAKAAEARVEVLEKVLREINTAALDQIRRDRPMKMDCGWLSRAIEAALARPEAHTPEPKPWGLSGYVTVPKEPKP